MPDCIYYINNFVLRTHARKAYMGIKPPIVKPVPKPLPDGKEPQPMPMPMPRPNPGKFKKFEAQPGGVDDSMETKVNPNPTQPMDNTLVSKVGEQMVPDTKRKTKKKPNNTGALGSSGGYL